MTSITQTSWQQVVHELRKSEPDVMRAWLLDLELPLLTHGMLTVLARNDAQVRHLERCRSAVARCAQVVFGRLVAVDVRLDGEATDARPTSEDAEDPLRCDFTLDRFVVGHENRLAHAAASRILNSEDRGCNPLFLHGPQGAGKTHLLQAICHAKNEGGEESAARFVSAGRFISEFTEHVESAVPSAFRRHYLEAGLLALDDVEFFAGKSRSQEELFHILNGLLAADRQIVLAADRPPDAISGLEARLASRLGAGLVVAMDPPSHETRLSILEQKSRAECFQFPQPVLRRIAERCPAEDLDQVLNRLNLLAQSQGGQVSMDLVDGLFHAGAVRDRRSLDGAVPCIDNGEFR